MLPECLPPLRGAGMPDGISQLFSGRKRSSCPHPAKPCLQSCHPATDTLPGVAAGRGRRLLCGKDVNLHRKGLRKMVSLRRHGGNGRGIGPALSFHAPNGAPDVPVRHTRGPDLADASASSAGMAAVRKGVKPFPPARSSRRGPARRKTGQAHPGNRRQTSTDRGLCRGTGVAGKNR